MPPAQPATAPAPPGAPVDPARRAAGLRAASIGALAAVALAAGCGFQLRGATRLPFRTLYLPSATPLGLELRRALRNSGAQLVERADAAEAVLDLPIDVREREILAFSSTGRPREYQLRLRQRFRLYDTRGRELIPATEITLRREIIVNDLQVTTRAEEEAILYRDMQADAVQQILRRIGAVQA